MAIPCIDYNELELAFMICDGSNIVQSTGFICRETGSIFVDGDSNEEDLPDDLYENDRYLQIPDKYELNLGNRLAFRFVAEFYVDDYDRVRSMFSRKGAYGRFREMLISRNALEAWNNYESAATKEALSNWCKENGLDAGV